jgi:hypothetical protein
MLAFGTKTPSGRAVRVVGVSRTGAIVAPSIALWVPGRGLGPCPKWASDGSRLAYLSGQKVVVRALDGSSLRVAPGDPVVEDFRRNKERLLSPRGDLIVRQIQSTCVVVIARPDGSDRRVLKRLGLVCPYAVAGWSPDGRKVILMQDVTGIHFTMVAVSVDAPFDIVPIVVQVPVNHARSWPGYGDVSWQPSPIRD